LLFRPLLQTDIANTDNQKIAVSCLEAGALDLDIYAGLISADAAKLSGRPVQVDVASSRNLGAVRFNELGPASADDIRAL
jgi:hypothetical protein